MPMMIMEPLMFLLNLFVIFLQLFVVRSQGQDLCMGCASDTSCHQFDSGNGKYVGCHGTFRDFGSNTEAAALCADGWSLMSVAEAAAESFTKAMCDTTPDDTIFFFNEGAGFALCNSDTGESDTVSLVGCLGGGTVFASGAFSLASACQGITSDAIIAGVAGIINGGTFGQAYNTLDMLDATYGGVVCIREPTPAPSEIPTAVPTAPSSVPSFNPTTEPSNIAIVTSDPTVIPTTAPTDATMVPSSNPSERPSSMPSFLPSITPTNEPTENPVGDDDATPEPTIEPTIEPTEEASDSYDDGHGNDWIEPCLRDPCVCRLDDNCKICNFGDHEGCSECIGTNGEYFKLDWNYPCRKCNDIFGDSCLFCQDFNGCAKCKKGYIRTYDENADLFYCDKKKKGKKKQRNLKKCDKQFGDGCLDCNKQLGCIECDEDNGYDMIMKNNGLRYCDSIDNNNNINNANNNVLDVNDKDVEDGSYSYSTVIMALIAGILSAYVVIMIYTRVKQFCIKTNTKLTQNTEYQPLL